MMLRKINAALSLITTVLCINHAASASIWMLAAGMITKPVTRFSWVLVGLMLVHVVVSVILMIQTNKEKKGKPAKEYPLMNRATIAQRLTGALSVLLLGVHVIGKANPFRAGSLQAILHPVFFAVILIHVSVSTSKALITLGIGNAKTIRFVDELMKVICGSIFVITLIGIHRLQTIGGV